MKNAVKIDFPNLREAYNEKGVLFARLEYGKPVATTGRFLVHPKGNAMWIEWVVEATIAKRTIETIPVTQEMLSGIRPASEDLLRDSNGEIVYQIPTPIKAVRDNPPSRL